LLRDDVLEKAGVTDFSGYLNGGREEDLALDLWVEPRGLTPGRVPFPQGSQARASTRTISVTSATGT